MSEEKGGWPVIEGSWGRYVCVTHSLAHMGQPELHQHDVQVRVGWRHEINPTRGCTWSLHETTTKIDKLLRLVDGKNLTELLQPARVPATAEWLALFLLVHAPAFYLWVEVEAYAGYRVRAYRGQVRAVWEKRLLKAGASKAVDLTT